MKKFLVSALSEWNELLTFLAKKSFSILSTSTLYCFISSLIDFVLLSLWLALVLLHLADTTKGKATNGAKHKELI
nr:hypothetical protein [Mycoplasmopsis bovis]